MTIPFRAVSRVEAADARQDFPFATSEVQPGAQDQHCVEIELRIEGAPGHCHVWTYMDPARLQRIWWVLVQGSQLLTYIRLPDAA